MNAVDGRCAGLLRGGHMRYMVGLAAGCAVGLGIAASAALADPQEDCDKAKEKPDLAIKACSQLIRHNPRDAVAYVKRGLEERHCRRPERAATRGRTDAYKAPRRSRRATRRATVATKSPNNYRGGRDAVSVSLDQGAAPDRRFLSGEAAMLPFACREAEPGVKQVQFPSVL